MYCKNSTEFYKADWYLESTKDQRVDQKKLIQQRKAS